MQPFAIASSGVFPQSSTTWEPPWKGLNSTMSVFECFSWARMKTRITRPAERIAVRLVKMLKRLSLRLDGRFRGRRSWSEVSFVEYVVSLDMKGCSSSGSRVVDEDPSDRSMGLFSDWRVANHWVDTDSLLCFLCIA